MSGAEGITYLHWRGENDPHANRCRVIAKERGREAPTLRHLRGPVRNPQDSYKQHGLPITNRKPTLPTSRSATRRKPLGLAGSSN
jgi:hypothetical protein